jgi:hypothetical protein
LDGRARRLNRALLARQGLLEPIDAPIPEALERIGGIQAQYAPSMYVGLWSRLAGFERDDLTDALQAREVIQATLMRGTIHLVSRADYWPLALAVRGARRRFPDPPPAAGLDAVRAALRGGPRPRKELGEHAARVHLWMDLVRVPPSGTWERRRADVYALAEDWIGPPPPGGDPVRHLVERYLGGFGPASRSDIASFTGLTPTELAPALEGLEADGDGLLDVPGAPLPDPDTPAPVRLLPTWDATLLVHARRSGVLPEQHRPRVFNTKMPQSVPTFLVDGAVAGAWRHTPNGIEIEPFERLDRATLRAVRDETARVASLFR